MKKLLNRIGSWNDRLLLKRGVTESSGLVYLQEKLFLVSIEIIVSIGFLAYLPSILLAFVEEQYLVVVIDTLVICSLGVLLFIHKIKSFLRISIILILLYALGVILLLYNGPYGTGLIYLLGFSVIAAAFLGLNYAKVSIAINAITLISLAVLLAFHPLDFVFFKAYLLKRWIVVSINFIILNGIISSALAYFVEGLHKSIDIENKLRNKLKKKSERLIEAKMRAEESDQLKSSFLANVSHEFRTPMNAIMGFTEIMMYTKPTEEKRQRYLENIRKSSEQLLQIIHNTIEYSKIELGTIAVEHQVFAIVDILDTVLEQHKHRCPKGVNYAVYGDENLISQRIYTDKEKLFQIFTNLILNAFKFTHEGEVGFGIMESAHKDYYQFFVKDTGIGIRKEKQKDIFIRFHKEDDFKEGTGLGLSISSTLIFHLGGRIWLESESGVGTTFYFIIPRITLDKNEQAN